VADFFFIFILWRLIYFLSTHQQVLLCLALVRERKRERERNWKQIMFEKGNLSNAYKVCFFFVPILIWKNGFQLKSDFKQQTAHKFKSADF
jgi:hypothetical protein